MTAIADVKTMIEAGIGRTATQAQLQKVAAGLLDAHENGIRIASISSVPFSPADPDNITNEEKAQLFKDATVWFWKQLLSNAAEKVTRQSNDAAVEAARAAAEGDLG